MFFSSEAGAGGLSNVGDAHRTVCALPSVPVPERAGFRPRAVHLPRFSSFSGPPRPRPKTETVSELVCLTAERGPDLSFQNSEPLRG